MSKSSSAYWRGDADLELTESTPRLTSGERIVDGVVAHGAARGLVEVERERYA